MVAVSYNQSDPAYRKEIGENQSSLKHILTSPAHYQAAKKRRFLPTVFMEMGSALHCKVLEGDEEFENRYVLKPNDLSLSTVAGKEWKAANKNKTILTNTDKDAAWDSVFGMTDALRELAWFNWDQEDYRKYNEVSIYWDEQGIPCKARLDRVVVEEDRVLVLDLKTTDSVEPAVFNKKVVGGLNYIFQAAWYAEAAEKVYKKPASFIFIGVERARPWSLGIFEVSQEMMEEGKAQIRRARQLLNECQATKKWPGPEISENLLELPPWYVSPLKKQTADLLF